ncbi:hypothetical protein UPYG_G00139160 [Umbra pygmaea]|uniref:Peroxiredoxin-like 2A n=1 Tax=Umbra pygmaea TaxID=75934 RepID=A0ABD0WZE5_UMBPY
MDVVVQSMGAIVNFIATILRSFTDVFLTKPSQATLKYLEETDLKSLRRERSPLKAKSLWEKSGAVIMAEAAELSSLKPQLDELGVPLYAVVKEDIGTEIQNFRPYFNGEIYVDEKRHFYGPRQRKMGLLAFLRLSVWMNGMRAFKNGFLGNVYGEGFVLGGVFVIGAGEQGILLEHREMEFGDKVNILEWYWEQRLNCTLFLVKVQSTITMLSFPLEGGLLSLSVCSVGICVLVAWLAGLILANTDLLLTTSAPSALEQLENTELRKTTADEETFIAKSLWENTGAVVMVVRRPGCALCREEAAELSSLRPQLDELGVPLYAVVKEHIGTEIQNFRPYFNGEIFVDEKKGFYGPKPRRMGLGLGLARLGVWQNILRARKKGYDGNRRGEGLVLGGVYVIGEGKKGILLEHKEKEFGDKAELPSVLQAAKKIKEWK